MAGADVREGPGGNGHPEKPAGKAKRLGRPPHPVPLKQRPVSLPDGLWAWALGQPEGASALVRALLESERNRRDGDFYDGSMAAGHQTMEVRTPFGGVTVLEMPGAGVMLLRDDERHHSFGYLADARGWRFTFGEDDVRQMLHVQASPTPRRARTAKRKKPRKAGPE